MSVQEQSIVCRDADGRVPEYICVNYPGNAVNVDNMIATLGGTEMISKVYSETNRRLELRFRPDDVYCKPVCGERTSSTALLVRVRRRVKKAKGAGRGSAVPSSTNASGEVVKVESSLLGVVNTSYNFNTMCDAQYLPLHSSQDSTSSSLPYSCFTPQNLELPSWQHEEPQQLFLPPAAFSRMDTPQFFFFRGDGSESFIKQEHNRASKSKGPESGGGLQPSGQAEAASTNATGDDTTAVTSVSSGDVSTSTIDCTSTSSGHMVLSSPAPNVICRTRQRRTLFAIFRNFHEKTPMEPDSQAMEQLQLKFLQRSIAPIYKKLEELFQERPIWSKNALKVKLGYGTDNLKYLLPTLGYYFNNGPWRNLWVRFGYDPREVPRAFGYQTFDYRLKQTGRLKSLIEAKRSYSKYILHYKSSSTSKRKISVIQSDLLGNDNNSANQDTSGAGIQDTDESPAASADSGASTSKVGVESSSAIKRPLWRMKSDDDDTQLPDEEEAGADLFKDEVYIFRPGTIPPYRQMFYQYCDLLVPEVQRVIDDTVLTTTRGKLRCNSRTGWLTKEAEDECRRIITRLIDEAASKRLEFEKD